MLRRAASIARKYDLAAAYEHNEDRTAWSLWLDLRWEHDGREVGFRLSQRTYDIPGSLEATYLLGPNVSLTGSKLPLAEAKPAELWRLVGDWAEQVLPG